MPAADQSSRLYIKSYFANSMDEALELARLELGSDALLMNEREAPPEARHLGAYEVVFGVRPDTLPAAVQGPDDPMGDLRQRIEELREMVSRLRPLSGSRAADSVVASQLFKAGVDEDLAADVDFAVQQRIRSTGVVSIGRLKHGTMPNTEEVLQETVAELESRIHVAPGVGRVCALVGPPGTGKTSTVVKLAISQGLMTGRQVRLLSIDQYRIGAAEHLRAYATIIGVPFVLVECTSELAKAIESAPKEALLLIDTPGHTAVSLQESGAELASFLRCRQDIDTHLVLTASMRQYDLRRTVDRFLAFGPSKLLFTHLDETDSTGSIYSEAARTGKPISFFSTGQLIPEDLEAAGIGRVTSPLVRELPQAMEAVA
jgi:flagellar biosynthesis protein FlhF